MSPLRGVPHAGSGTSSQRVAPFQFDYTTNFFSSKVFIPDNLKNNIKINNEF